LRVCSLTGKTAVSKTAVLSSSLGGPAPRQLYELKTKKMNAIKFIKSVLEEGRKVEWLNRKDLFKYSKIVIVFIIVATTFIALLDVSFINLRTFVTESILF
jgi:preprotein translocase SecE subunit